MNFEDNVFRIADSYLPPLDEGKYVVKLEQEITRPETDYFSQEKSFYVAANTETLSDDNVFSIYPAPEQQGQFSGDLPFIVFNNPTYPWLKDNSKDSNGFNIPWIALIVVSENETVSQRDVKHSELPEEKNEENVYFPYDKNEISFCNDDDNIHLLTITKDTFDKIMPDKEDLVWLTHSKFVNLSATDDMTIQNDGWFSTIIANRFIPSVKNEIVKSTVHLVCAYRYDNVPDDCKYVKMISLYHWNVYSEEKEDKSFVSLVNGLKENSSSIMDGSLKPHYLRSGEKTYSIYCSPITSMKKNRGDNINGEEKYTSDGRLIYDSETGIFDVSYSAAFNLGRIVTLSHNSKAQQIVSWRKMQKVNRHIKNLNSEIGFSDVEVKNLCKKLRDGKLI